MIRQFRDNWCTKKGLNERKKGMYTIEKKRRRNRIAFLFSISALIYLALGSYFAERTYNSERIREDFTNEKMDSFKFKAAHEANFDCKSIIKVQATNGNDANRALVDLAGEAFEKM